MADKPEVQQFGRRRRFRSFFLFRIGPGFFVGIVPFRRGFRDSWDEGDEFVEIRRVSESEYMFLRRMGVCEASYMEHDYGGC